MPSGTEIFLQLTGIASFLLGLLLLLAIVILAIFYLLHWIRFAFYLRVNKYDRWRELTRIGRFNMGVPNPFRWRKYLSHEQDNEDEKIIRHKRIFRRRRKQIRIACSLVLACIFLIFLINIVGPKGAVLAVTGDEAEVAAEIFVDSEKMGVMEKHVIPGSKSTDPVVMEREKRLPELSQKLDKLSRAEPDRIIAVARIRVDHGTHVFLFVSPEGKRLEEKIVVDRDMHLIIDFAEMTIEVLPYD